MSDPNPPEPDAPTERALGDAATATAEVVVPRLRRHPSATETVRHALARSVEQILRHDPAVRLGEDPEDLHQLRVGIRRLRSDLRTFRHLLPADGGTEAGGDPSSRLRDELGWIADQTNRLRDLDVLQAWVERRARSMPHDDQPAVGRLIERYQEEAATERAALRRSLASRRYRQLVHDLGALIDLLGAEPELGEKAERRARRQLDRQVRRRWERLDAAVARVSGDPTDAALHRVRIAAKQCRATAEAVEPLAGRTMRRFARSLAELQDVLGAAHDAAVMDALLRRSSDTPEAFAAGRLASLAELDGQAQHARWPQTWAKVQRRHDRITRLG